MKKLINLFVEVSLAISVAFLFSLFSDYFWLWLVAILLCLLAWHHVTEFRLLQALNPKKNRDVSLINLESFSQTVAYYRNKNKKEKRENLRLLSKLNKNIQYLPDAMFICQKDGEISWCNQIAQQMFDFYWHKKMHKNIFNVIFYEQFKPYFQQSKKTRPLVLFTHNQRYLEIHIHYYDAQTLFIVTRDITEMIRLLHSRQTFLNNINHELRTPLTVLQGYLEMLADAPADAFQQKAVEAMQAQSQRMATLLRQLDLLAKIESSSSKDHCAFNMSEMINSLQNNSEILNCHQHQIDFNIAPNIHVLGNENQLHSAVSNLVYNAIKHAGKPSQIQVSWQPCEQGVQFKVQDNGNGIPATHIPHLTERFYRINHQASGSGLGLAIVKHALEQHHSHLEIQSEENQGSTFSFVIKQRFIVSV
ncbi:PAS domain-containing sensor histidine kinase [Pasteurellaceae bacterium Pebbles2]|nr:PAS domain-containing sensor histidine kinase [Pasteurellaceae bacterium Pebbles2]